MDNFNGKDIFAAIAAKFDRVPRHGVRSVVLVRDRDVDRLVEGVIDALGEIEGVGFIKPRRVYGQRLTAAEYIARTVALTVEDYNENWEQPAPAALMRGLQDLAATLTEDAVKVACLALEQRVAFDATLFLSDLSCLMYEDIKLPPNLVSDLIREAAMIISKEIKKEAAFAA